MATFSENHANINDGIIEAKDIVCSTSKHAGMLTGSISNYKAYFHCRFSLCAAITEVWRSIWLWMESLWKETNTNRHRHERDVGLIESIIEPAVRSMDLFSISKHSQTLDGTENGEHRACFSEGFQWVLLYSPVMCKCETNKTEFHNIGHSFMSTNDRHI